MGRCYWDTNKHPENSVIIKITWKLRSNKHNYGTSYP